MTTKSSKTPKKKPKKESLLKFPCEFPIKVVGPAGEQFEIDIIMIMRKHAPDLGETAIKNSQKQRWHLSSAHRYYSCQKSKAVRCYLSGY